MLPASRAQPLPFPLPTQAAGIAVIASANPTAAFAVDDLAGARSGRDTAVVEMPAATTRNQRTTHQPRLMDESTSLAADVALEP